MQKTSEFLELYISRGLTPIPLTILPLERGGKAAVVSDWSNRSREDLFNCFGYLAEFNIGLRLDGLIAFDLERPELWDVFFRHPIEVVASSTWVQRTGKGYHVLFRGEAKPFKVDGLAEIRSGRGQYIVVAPSIHPETKKPYEWITDIEKTPIAEIGEEDLKRCYKKLEVLKRFRNFTEAMVECWKRYHRHNLGLWLSGVLRKLGLPLEEAEVVLKTIALLSHDEELSDRLRALHDTYRKHLEEVKGWSGLREELIEITGSEGEAREILKAIPIQKGLLFQVKSLKELIEGAKTIEYLSYPLLPRGALIILAGRGGVGKSMICLHMAHEVARGGRLFGLYECGGGRVLISDNENSPSIYKARIEAMKLNPIDNIDVLNFSQLRFDSKGAISKLKNLIKSNNYELVIIDNWTTHVSRVEENKAVEVSSILMKLRKVAYETGCTILLIHHLRKGLPFAVNEVDELRGSSVLVNEADLVMVLYPDRVTSRRLLRVIKNRLGGETPSLLITFESSENGLKLAAEEIGGIEADTKTIEAARAIVDYLKLKGAPVTRRELVEALPGFGGTAIKRSLAYLLAMGAIQREKRGVYRLRHTLEDALSDPSGHSGQVL
ncbi:MAG: AAA family ATPase [Nitrososphaerota archaeon]